jgi:hypothetical protein
MDTKKAASMQKAERGCTGMLKNIGCRARMAGARHDLPALCMRLY